MNDIRLALMCGIDIPLIKCNIVLHQPTIKEIALMGERDFFTGIQVLCISSKLITQGKTLLSDISNFQIFMMVMQEKEAKEKRDAAMQLLQLLFPKYRVLLTPRSLSLGDKDGNQITIDDNNFEELQEVLGLVFCTTSSKQKEKEYNPANAKAQEIANKLAKARQKISKLKGENDISIFTQYLSILTIGLNSMSLQNLMNLTMYQLYDLVERFNLWQSYDIDIRSRLAGAKMEKPPENWMKNIHDNS